MNLLPVGLCRLVALVSSGLTVWTQAQTPPESFVNWETAPVHPVALSPDGSTLAVCNLPDARVELFSLGGTNVRPLGNVPVGLDPVSVRFRNDDELWVVNHISDSVSIVNLAGRRVVATLQTLDEPADIAFAGSPPRAFVSCAGPGVLQVFSPETRELVEQVVIEGLEPKALSRSRDGESVIAAIFRSGNGSTILGTGVALGFPRASPVDFPQGPHAGENPPPNTSAGFSPLLSTNWPAGTKPPRVGLIVKKDEAGVWRDDTGGDWTDFVRGTNAVLSGRPTGWDVPDHDIAVVDAATLRLRYINGLMNLCMDVAVNPASGAITVIGTDATNERRFEPVLQATFLRVTLAIVEPETSARRIVDLNPHLKGLSLPLGGSETVRMESVGDPRGIVWNAAGTTGYIVGMGSNNLLLVDAEGRRLRTIALAEGPAGLAMDDRRHRLYILNRFASTLMVFDTDQNEAVESLALFDPTPQLIRTGRKHLYDTHRTSGSGHVACASCHVDAQMDGLAWDLGDPAGAMSHITSSSHNFGRFPPAVTNDFHPMKGPMVTQTLQDIVGHEPFHWRGDRSGIEQFNQTYRALQGTDAELTPTEMAELKAFLGSIAFPPNPFRNFDNSLSTNLPLPGHFVLGRGPLPRGAPMPNGNARAGLVTFRDDTSVDCISCHTLPTGLGPDMRFNGARWSTVLAGPNFEHHAALIALDRSEQRPFKIPQLRNLYKKLGADFQHTNSPAGFGFFHDGSVDSLTRFVQDGFNVRADDDAANLVALLLSFSGSDLPPGSATDVRRAPGLPSRDVPAGVGRQVTIHGPESAAQLAPIIALARASTSRVDLVVRGLQEGLPRGWVFDRTTSQFQSDRSAEVISVQSLQELAREGNELTYTLVPRGSGRRLGIDRDADGIPDRTEMDEGSDPNDSRSASGNTAPTLAAISDRVLTFGEGLRLQAAATDPDGAKQTLIYSFGPGVPLGATVDSSSGLVEWMPERNQSPGSYAFTINVSDDGTPPLSATRSFRVQVRDPEFRLGIRRTGEASVEVSWNSRAGVTYRVQSQTNADNAWRTITGNLKTAGDRMTNRVNAARSPSAEYFRVELVE